MGPALAVLLLLSFCLPAASLARAEGGSGRLVLACPDDIPPYCTRDENGRAVGLLPDFWRLFAKKTGMQVELRLASSAEALMSDHVFIFDTTLRDGEQSPGATMHEL